MSNILSTMRIKQQQNKTAELLIKSLGHFMNDETVTLFEFLTFCEPLRHYENVQINKNEEHLHVPEKQFSKAMMKIIRILEEGVVDINKIKKKRAIKTFFPENVPDDVHDIIHYYLHQLRLEDVHEEQRNHEMQYKILDTEGWGEWDLYQEILSLPVFSEMDRWGPNDVQFIPIDTCFCTLCGNYLQANCEYGEDDENNRVCLSVFWTHACYCESNPNVHEYDEYGSHFDDFLPRSSLCNCKSQYVIKNPDKPNPCQCRKNVRKIHKLSGNVYNLAVKKEEEPEEEEKLHIPDDIKNIVLGYIDDLYFSEWEENIKIVHEEALEIKRQNEPVISEFYDYGSSHAICVPFSNKKINGQQYGILLCVSCGNLKSVIHNYKGKKIKSRAITCRCNEEKADADADSDSEEIIKFSKSEKKRLLKQRDSLFQYFTRRGLPIDITNREIIGVYRYLLGIAETENVIRDERFWMLTKNLAFKYIYDTWM